MNKIIGTLFLPISYKPHIFPEWENNLRNVNLPRDKMKVVLCDSTGGSEVGLNAASVIKSLGFAKHHIEVFNQNTTVPDIRKHWNHFCNMGERVGETFEAGVKHSEGPLFMFLEDDVVIHPDTFNVLTDRLLANDSIGFVGACTFKKRQGNTTDVIGQDFNRNPIILREGMPNMINTNWMPTGCCVSYGSIARQFNFKTSVLAGFASPDITFCKYLMNHFNKKVYLSTDVRTKHLYTRSGRKIVVGEIRCPSRKSITYPIKGLSNNPTVQRTKDAPIFIVSYTGRAGSTLIQRILSSSPDIMIWGEDHGALDAIFDFSTRMFEVNKQPVVKTGRSQFNKHGYKGWLACSPPKTIRPLIFTGAQIRNFYNPGEEKIWGIKSIDWDSKMVTRMHSIFPKATFIFLHRNMKDVEYSYNHKRGWWKPGTFVEWVKNYKRLTEMSKTISNKMHMIEIDFDESKKDLAGMCHWLEEELMLDENSLDRSILDDYISTNNDANATYGKNNE